MHGIKILDNYKPSLTIVTPNGNVVIDLLTAEIEFQGDVLPNEAARTFWNEMKIVGESLTEQLAKAVAEAERLRAENEKLKAVAGYAAKVAWGNSWAMKEMKELLRVAGYDGNLDGLEG